MDICPENSLVVITKNCFLKMKFIMALPKASSTIFFITCDWYKKGKIQLLKYMIIVIAETSFKTSKWSEVRIFLIFVKLIRLAVNMKSKIRFTMKLSRNCTLYSNYICICTYSYIRQFWLFYSYTNLDRDAKTYL